MPDEFIDITKDPDKAKRALAAGRQRVENALQQAMEKALAMIEADAKRECPVDDGRLRASITHTIIVEEHQVRGRVGTNVAYAPYVHEGTGIHAVNGNGRQTPWGPFRTKDGEWRYTRGMKPRPFLQLAKEKNRGKITKVFVEAVKALD